MKPDKKSNIKDFMANRAMTYLASISPLIQTHTTPIPHQHPALSVNHFKLQQEFKPKGRTCCSSPLIKKESNAIGHQEVLKRVSTGIGAQTRQTRTNLPGVSHADRHYSRNCIEHGVIKQSIVRKGAAGALQTSTIGCHPQGSADLFRSARASG